MSALLVGKKAYAVVDEIDVAVLHAIAGVSRLLGVVR